MPFAFAGPGTSEWWLGAVLLIRGLGPGVVLIPVMTVAFVDIGERDMPDASMLTRISQTRPAPVRWPDSRQLVTGGR